jgi:2-enoate reductase
MADLKKYFEPGRIGSMKLPNRIIMAPMRTGYAEPDGRFTARHIDYFCERAKGGVGLIITGAAKIENALECYPRMGLPYADSDIMITAMHDLTSAVHDFGVKIALQLSAGLGRQAPLAGAAAPVISASAIPAFADPSITCRSLSVEEIQYLVKAFGAAALRAKQGGFDMVEIHGHVGYLVDQFISGIWNKRTDAYGGSFDKRMRFAIELITEIRKNVGPDYPISFRLAVDHGMPGGRSVEESQQIARQLEAAGVDAIHADAGCAETIDLIFPTAYLGDACIAYTAKAIKEVVNIPVIAVGNMTPAAGAEILADGQADFIAFGRQLIADPDFPLKMKRGRLNDIRPCIRCNEKCVGIAFKQLPTSCSVNPMTGKEKYYELKKSEIPKKVLVIGGGPAGMEAARVARIKGHNVILMEKADALGGQLRAAGAAEFKKELHALVEWYKHQMKKIGVDIRMNETASLEIIRQIHPDAVILATGAVPVKPDIPGINGENIIDVIDFHIHSTPLKGDRVVIAGGGLSGCEAALDLVGTGKKVTIIEMLPELALGMNVVSRISLLGKLAKAGVIMKTGHVIQEFRHDGVLATDARGDQPFFAADAIILAMGMKSDNTLAKQLRTSVEELHEIGDCINPAKVAEAIQTGFVAGWRV